MDVEEENDEEQNLSKLVTRLKNLLRHTPIKSFNESGPKHLPRNSFDWNNMDHRTVALSCMVKGVYKMEQERQDLLTGLNLEPQDNLWWEFFNFTLTEKLMDPIDESIYGAVFNYNSNRNTPDSNPPLRRVIAFRGTMLRQKSLYCDLFLDLCCLLDSLHRRRRFKHALKVIKNVVEVTGKEAVWLAGHSLGASIALLAGKIMTKSGSPLESHLFNPPFLSINPIEMLLDSEIHKHGLRFAVSLLKASADKALRDKCHHKGKDKSYEKLKSWRPYLYLNQSDWFCTRYISYFEHRTFMSDKGAEDIESRATMHSFISLLKRGIRRVVGSSSRDYPSEPLHLLPSAYLKIHPGEGPHNSSVTGHELDQWWDLMCAGEFRSF